MRTLFAQQEHMQTFKFALSCYDVYHVRPLSSSTCDHTCWLAKALYSLFLSMVYKSGDKSDVSNYKGITVGAVIANVFAMSVKQRTTSWAETDGCDTTLCALPVASYSYTFIHYGLL